MKKYILILSSIIASTLPFKTFADCPTGVIACGTDCGEHCSWEIKNGVLTLTGWGDISSHGLYASPWFPYKSEVQKLVIQNTEDTTGFKSIGTIAFCAMTSMKEAVLPDTLETIGYSAFHYARSLEKINLPDNLKTIEQGAFNYTQISEFILPEDIELNGIVALGSRALTSVVVQGNTELIQDDLKYTINGDWVNLALPGTLKTIYCEVSNSSCQALLDDSELASKIKIYTLKGDRYVVDGAAYKSLSDMQHKIPVKRIYTIDEANAVTKPTGNMIRIKYR